MLNKFQKNIKVYVKQLPNLNSLINVKSALYFGLAAYWSVMLLGTFIGL